MFRRLGFAVGLLGMLCGTTGCWSLLYRTALPSLYTHVERPPERVLRDRPYREGPAADPDKHRFDLYLPDEGVEPWPLLLFAHGGGWTSGDRAYRLGDHDVYGNIGRALAAAGIGSAVISYRLAPEAGWREQVDDVARALAVARGLAAEHGGDPEALYLAGHSAGAWLAAQVVLEPAVLAGVGVPGSSVCGWIPVSGSGYDLIDAETYELGLRRAYYEERFREGPEDTAWDLAASPVLLARADAPPALVMHAGGEWAPLRRQSQLLHAALQAAGAPSTLFVLPGEGHLRMILALSRRDKAALPAVRDFVARTRCSGAAAPSVERAPSPSRAPPPAVLRPDASSIAPGRGPGASGSTRPTPRG